MTNNRRRYILRPRAWQRSDVAALPISVPPADEGNKINARV